MPEQTTEIPEAIMRECEAALDAMGGWQEHHDLGAITEAVAPVLTAPLREELADRDEQIASIQKESDENFGRADSAERRLGEARKRVLAFLDVFDHATRNEATDEDMVAAYRAEQSLRFWLATLQDSQVDGEGENR